VTRLRPDAQPAPSGRHPTGRAGTVEKRITALRDLLRDVCAAGNGRDLAPRWGTTDGPASPSARFVIDCPAGTPFEAIGVVPWPDETYGVVDVRLRRAPWDVAPFEQAFGPFREEVQIPGAPRRLVATWEEPDLPATAFLTLWVGSEGITSLGIRRDPRP
jgi:hypothetical protein